MKTVAELLNEAEDLAAYSTQPEIVRLECDKEIFIVSDLHIARGRDNSGNYAGTENFFYDDEFARFLRRIDRSASGDTALLVINGDFADFLRVTDLPQGQESLSEWSRFLRRLGIDMSESELQDSISHKEYSDGLKTHEFKSVWKLMALAEGHYELFTALADWMRKGNEVIILKGNHDLEWVWPGVRNALRLILADRMCELDPDTSFEDHLSSLVSGLGYIDKALLLNNDLYIEHGHRYDPFSSVRPVDQDFLSEKKDQLNLPLGSFFNRYLINKIELAYPYYDNVRPRAKLLPMLIREKLPLAIKLLFWHLPFVLRVLPKKQYAWPVIRPAVLFVMFVLLPVGFVGYQLYQMALPLFANVGANQSETALAVTSQVSSFLKGVGALALSYFVARLVSYLQLEEPSTLAPEATMLMKKVSQAKYFVMGHTHFPEQFMAQSGQYFYNSGTWIPVVETSSAAIRNDKTFSLLRFSLNAFGKYSPTVLERWNDNAERIEPLILTTEKASMLKRIRVRRKTKKMLATVAAS
jgi:UDP-2,3-diacylglucosamine pyrophosphatase LpxH